MAVCVFKLTVRRPSPKPFVRVLSYGSNNKQTKKPSTFDTLHRQCRYCSTRACDTKRSSDQALLCQSRTQARGVYRNLCQGKQKQNLTAWNDPAKHKANTVGSGRTLLRSAAGQRRWNAINRHCFTLWLFGNGVGSSAAGPAGGPLIVANNECARAPVTRYGRVGVCTRYSCCGYHVWAGWPARWSCLPLSLARLWLISLMRVMGPWFDLIFPEMGWLFRAGTFIQSPI